MTDDPEKKAPVTHHNTGNFDVYNDLWVETPGTRHYEIWGDDGSVTIVPCDPPAGLYNRYGGNSSLASWKGPVVDLEIRDSAQAHYSEKRISPSMAERVRRNIRKLLGK